MPKRPLEFKQAEASMRTMVSLTSAFESLSSMKIMQTKRKVLISNEFFNEVWNIYKQIRVDATFNFGREEEEKHNGRELLVLITAEMGLTGDIDQRLINTFRKYYDPSKHDILVIGHHGATQLDALGIEYQQFFDLPKKDYINVDPLIAVTKPYSSSRVFYQDYVSMSEQAIKSMDMSEAISAMGKIVDLAMVSDDVISEKNYIFEPDAYAVTSYIETAILRLMLTQFIFDSRLAQYASRFKAMTAAKERSIETANELHMQFNRAKRLLVDTRIKESLAGLKKIRSGGNL